MNLKLCTVLAIIVLQLAAIIHLLVQLVNLSVYHAPTP